jgi:hypothetical protein
MISLPLLEIVTMAKPFGISNRTANGAGGNFWKLNGSRYATSDRTGFIFRLLNKLRIVWIAIAPAVVLPVAKRAFSVFPMFCKMLRVGLAKAQIFNPVVIFNSVNVMDYLRWKEQPSKVAFHDQPVLEDPSRLGRGWMARLFDMHVPIAVGVATSIAVVIFSDIMFVIARSAPLGVFATLFSYLVSAIDAFNESGVWSHSSQCISTCYVVQCKLCPV